MMIGMNVLKCEQVMVIHEIATASLDYPDCLGNSL